MPEHPEEHIGDRLKTARKRRGLSQRELSSASGVSLSWIRQLEQGTAQDTRMETAHSLARALRVTTSELISGREPETGPTPEPWRPLQQAVELPPAALDEEPTAEGIAVQLPAVRAAFFGNRMSELVQLLAPLLRDADALDDNTEARAVRAHLLNIAGSTLTQARQFRAADTALRRALDDAPDRLRAASVVTTWCWLLVRQGKFDEARKLAVKWADDLEPRLSRATPEDLASWGWLLLQVSASALRDNRRGEAKDAMKLAHAVGVMTGEELPRGEDRLATWGPVTVAYKQAERGVVLDRPDKVLKTAKRLESAVPGASTEYWRHRLDVAKARTMMHQHDAAFGVLADVHEKAPEWLANQQYARDILDVVVSKRRTLTPAMRAVADAIKLPL